MTRNLHPQSWPYSRLLPCSFGEYRLFSSYPHASSDKQDPSPPSPSCSPDYSYCLPDDSAIPLEKPCLDVKKGFNDLSSLVATSFFQSFIVREPHSEVYNTYGLKGREEVIIFYEEHVGTPPSPVLCTSSPGSMVKLPTNQGESTCYFSGHGQPVGVSTGPFVTLVQPTVVAHRQPAAMALSRALCHPGPYSPLYISLVERHLP